MDSTARIMLRSSFNTAHLLLNSWKGECVIANRLPESEMTVADLQC